MRVGYLGLGVGLGYAMPHKERRRNMMEFVENVAFIVFLLFLGVSATFAVLLGMLYMFEVLND